MQDEPISTENFELFAAAIRQSESTDNYKSRGPHPKTKNRAEQYFGAYQLGYLALADAGFIQKQGDLKNPKWTAYAKSLGVHSVETFLENKPAQDIAFSHSMEANENYLASFKDYLGKTILTATLGDVYVTESGLLAAAHFVGHGKVEKFLSSGGKKDDTDGNNVHVSEYLAQFAGYNFTYDPKSGTFVDAPDAAGTDKIIQVERSAAIAYRVAHRSGAVHERHKHVRVHGHSVTHSFLYHDKKTKPSAMTGLRRAHEQGLEPAFVRPQRRSFALNGQGGGNGVLSRLGDTSSSTVRVFGEALSVNRASASNDGANLFRGPNAHALHAPEGSYPVRPLLRFSVASRSGQGMPSFAPSGAMETGFVAKLDELPLSLREEVAAGGLARAEGRFGFNSVIATRFRTGASSGSVVNPAPEFGEALEDYFFRQARLPPSGGTAFDPRLTPAWAGVKLPF